MFSVFGPSGAPTKMGPHMRKTMSVFVIFNNIPSASGGFAPRPPPGLRPWAPLGDFRLPPCKIPAGAHGGPAFFSEQGKL